MNKLSQKEIEEALTSLTEWDFSDNALRRQFDFEDFDAAIAFINQVAEVARKHNHHPTIENTYNKVVLTLSTHDEAGVTEKDTALAHDIEKL